MGCMMAWPAPSLRKLREPDSPIHLNYYQEGMVVSALFIGKILSPLPSGTIMHSLGPKRSILVLGALPILSWILIYISTNPHQLIVARLLAGFWPGVVQTLVPIYMAEISEPHVRGIFGSFFLLCSYCGQTFTYVVAPFVTVQTMAVICEVLLVLNLFLFSLCPESPYFYVMQKQTDLAEKSLAWLRGGVSVQTELELELIQISIEKEAKNGGNRFLQKFATLVKVRANRKAFTIVGFMAIMDKLSGINAITSFSFVFLPASLGVLNPDDCNIIFILVSMASLLFVLCTGLTHKVGRKPLLQFSSFGICLSMLWTGGWYLMNSSSKYDVSHYNWLLLAGYLVFGCAYSIGLGFIAPIYQGEMFPSKLKGQASALTTMIAGFSSSAITLLFPVIQEKYGIYWNFFAFSAMGVVNSLFTYFYVIETEGKSLQTIQAELSNGKTDPLKEVGESVRLLDSEDKYNCYVY